MQEEYIPDLISLSDDEGNEYTFEVLSTMEDNGSRYAALTPCDENGEPLPDDDGTLVILKEIEDNGEFYYEEIEDDNEYNMIADAFIAELQDLYEVDAD